jgi:hypothetical protein
MVSRNVTCEYRDSCFRRNDEPSIVTSFLKSRGTRHYQESHHSDTTKKEAKI